MPMRPVRSTLFELLALATLAAACGCASTSEPGPTIPRTVYIPTGWLAITKTKPSAAQPATNEASAEPEPIVETAAPASDAPVVIELSTLFTDTTTTALLPRDDTKSWFNPLPKGVFSGYAGDTGLDIASPPRPVYAIAAGTFDYSEEGHTRWTGKNDTPNSIRIALDAPIAWKGHRITHLYYTHLSALRVVQPEGSKTRYHVHAGEQIGVSGQANGMPHLHLGMLLDDQVEQDEWGTFLLEGEIRAVLGGYKNGDVLPGAAS
jgi:murein DD-endopeptidase MepM/ murein hydrolase activator NlpD